MASGYLDGAKDIVNITSANQYFISIVLLCFMLVSFTCAKADLINNDNKIVYPFKFRKTNFKLSDQIENENKNQETRHPLSKSVGRNLHSMSLNYDELVDLITKPGNRSDSRNNFNSTLFFKNVSHNLEFGSRKYTQSSFEEKSRTIVDTEMISKSINNTSLLPKEHLDCINRTKMKNSVHKFKSSEKKIHNLNETRYNKLSSEFYKRNVKNRLVNSDLGSEMNEDILNKKNYINNNKLTSENFELSLQSLSTYSPDTDKINMNYIYDQIKSDSEINEILIRSKNTIEKELKTNDTNIKPNKKKGVKKIKQSKNKNSTKSDHNIHLTTNNVRYNKTSEFMSKNSEVITEDALGASKFKTVKRNEYEKLNNSEKLMLLKKLINKELAEHKNKNKQIPDLSFDNFWHPLVDDDSNISPEGSFDEPSTIPISINVYIFNDDHQRTTESTNHTDFPQFLMIPFQEYDPWKYANPDELHVFDNSTGHSSPEEESLFTFPYSPLPSETPVPRYKAKEEDIDDPVEITVLKDDQVSKTTEKSDKNIKEDSKKEKDICSSGRDTSEDKLIVCDDGDTGKDMVTAMTVMLFLAVSVLGCIIVTIGWKIGRQKIIEKKLKNKEKEEKEEKEDSNEKKDLPKDTQDCDDESSSSTDDECCD